MPERLAGCEDLAGAGEVAGHVADFDAQQGFFVDPYLSEFTVGIVCIADDGPKSNSPDQIMEFRNRVTVVRGTGRRAQTIQANDARIRSRAGLLEHKRLQIGRP